MKYLVIDRTKVHPVGLVVDRCGKHCGTTQMLHDNEVKDYARWLGTVGGRDLLDAFEVQLINDGKLCIYPVDEDGEPLHDECDAVEIRRYDDGPRLVWEAKIPCETCGGNGHFDTYGDPVGEDDICMFCDGNGYTWGQEFETNMDGGTLTPNKN